MNNEEQDTIDSEERCYWMEIIQLPIDDVEEDPISLLQQKIEFLMEERVRTISNINMLHASNQGLLKNHNYTKTLINDIKAQLQLATSPDNGIGDKSNFTSLDQDTFSIMMTSKFCSSSGWLLGLVTFICQIALIILILVGQAAMANEASATFGAPCKVDTSVRVGQFFAVILSVFTQNDVLTAIKYMVFFRNCDPIGNVTYWHKI